jgi:hypothetical protein
MPFAWSIESYKVVVRALDKEDAPLNGAWVKITTQYAIDDFRSQEKQTNASGFAIFDQVNSSLPSAEVRIYWRGVIVAHQTVTLDSGTNEFNILCNVSNLTISTIDGNNNPLKAAEVTVSWVTDITYSTVSKTNSEGIAVFPQMPHYGYQVSVRWQSMLVYESAFNLTSSTSTYVAQCQVFSLTVHVTNRRDQAIQGSTVTVTHTENDWSLLNATGSDGIAIFAQVPSGSYTILITYQATSNMTAISLTQNKLVSIKLNIAGSFEVTVQVAWSDGEPVTNAIVTVQNNHGQQLFSGASDEYGTLTVVLSEGTYVITVVKNALSTTQNVTVTNQTIVFITFDASLRTYTLTIEVIDERGLKVDSAVVELYQNGKLIDDSQTIGGTAIFNVKQGTYKVIVRLNGKQREEVVEVNDDVRRVMSFYEGNPITLLLTFIVIPILIAASLGTLVFYFRRKSGCFSLGINRYFKVSKLKYIASIKIY